MWLVTSSNSFTIFKEYKNANNANFGSFEKCSFSGYSWNPFSGHNQQRHYCCIRWSSHCIQFGPDQPRRTLQYREWRIYCSIQRLLSVRQLSLGYTENMVCFTGLNGCHVVNIPFIMFWKGMRIQNSKFTFEMSYLGSYGSNVKSVPAKTKSRLHVAYLCPCRHHQKVSYYNSLPSPSLSNLHWKTE